MAKPDRDVDRGTEVHTSASVVKVNKDGVKILSDYIEPDERLVGNGRAEQ